jgi:hypothetical protein
VTFKILLIHVDTLTLPQVSVLQLPSRIISLLQQKVAGKACKAQKTETPWFHEMQTGICLI